MLLLLLACAPPLIVVLSFLVFLALEPAQPNKVSICCALLLVSDLSPWRWKLIALQMGSVSVSGPLLSVVPQVTLAYSPANSTCCLDCLFYRYQKSVVSLSEVCCCLPTRLRVKRFDDCPNVLILFRANLSRPICWEIRATGEARRAIP